MERYFGGVVLGRVFGLGLGLVVSLLLGCNPTRLPALADAASGEILAEFSEVARIGRRDGDRMPTRISMTSNDSRLDLTLLFQIGVPTLLLEGSYVWNQKGETRTGAVQSRSVTFLGGQSDNPNLGGVFQLLNETGSTVYTVVVPTGEVRPR